MVQDVKQPKPPIRLWLRIVLGVSLALNFLVLGLAGGAMLRFGGPDGMRPPPRSIGAILFRELPRADRRALWSGSKNIHADRYARQKADALVLGAALRVSPFDEAAVATLLGEHAMRRAGLYGSLQQAWLTRVSAMSEAERGAYADRLETALDRSWIGRRHKERHGE